MSLFQFQQFSIKQESSGMKICTDSLIFGCMAPIRGGEHVLDIGTGTGLLALITAQLGASSVTAIEITQEAFQEAQFNFQNSPWSERIRAIHQDIREFNELPSHRFGLIICNPPFFSDNGQITNNLRRIARHNNLLSLTELFVCVNKNLSFEGNLYIMLPAEPTEEELSFANENQLYLNQKLAIRSYNDRSAHVYAFTFSRNPVRKEEKILTLFDAPNIYSKESENFLKPFLLRFSDKKSPDS